MYVIYRMEEVDEVPCSVEKWCNFVDMLSNEQRGALFGSGVHCMLEMPRIRMRQSVLKFLVQAFDLKTSTFGLNEGKDHISLGGKEIYALFGLEDKGLNAVAIIAQEGKEAQGRIPPEWLDPSTENLLIDDLILDVELRGASDDDFVRKAMMVLLATVIAPYSNKVISKPMYALVEDLDRARKINWNSFTLEYTLEGIRQCKGGRVMRQWPKGNMAALQVNRNIS
jgi:hypothetical protein